MEEAGRVRRGYFVEGLGATQFALPGADERLRALRDPADLPEMRGVPTIPATLLAATDPANPYGATLPWPEKEGAHPQRAAGAQVLLWNGALLGVIARGEQSLTTWLPTEQRSRAAALDALASALAGRVDEGPRRAILISRIDGIDAGDSPLAPAFAARGFTPGQRGLFKRRPLESATPLPPRAPGSTATPRSRTPGRNRLRGPLGPDLPARPPRPPGDDDEPA